MLWGLNASSLMCIEGLFDCLDCMLEGLDGSKYHYVIQFALDFQRVKYWRILIVEVLLIDGVEWIRRSQLWRQGVEFCCFVFTCSTIWLVVWFYFKGVVMKVFSNYKSNFQFVANLLTIPESLLD